MKEIFELKIENNFFTLRIEENNRVYLYFHIPTAPAFYGNFYGILTSPSITDFLRPLLDLNSRILPNDGGHFEHYFCLRGEAKPLWSETIPTRRQIEEQEQPIPFLLAWEYNTYKRRCTLINATALSSDLSIPHLDDVIRLYYPSLKEELTKPVKSDVYIFMVVEENLHDGSYSLFSTYAPLKDYKLFFENRLGKIFFLKRDQDIPFFLTEAPEIYSQIIENHRYKILSYPKETKITSLENHTCLYLKDHFSEFKVFKLTHEIDPYSNPCYVYASPLLSTLYPR